MKEQEMGLPKGWEITNIENTFKQISTTGKKVLTINISSVGKYPVLDQGEQFISGYYDDEDKVIRVEDKVILFGDHTRNFKLINFDFIIGGDGAKIFQPNRNIDPLFFYYQCLSLELPNKGYHRHFKYLKECNFILPPLPEQQHLSQKLTALLDGVAEAKQRLEKIPALLKQFRQSVLADAVSGKLVGEDFNLDNMKKLSETDVVIKTGPFGSALHKDEYVSNGIPVINPMHISDGKIIPSSSMSISEDKFLELSRWQLNKNEVILGRRGEMGRAAVVLENMLPMLCGTGSIVLSSKQILSDYLVLVLRSPTAVNFFNQSSVGSTMVNLNQKIIKELKVYIPSIEQQTQIIQKVETYFALADKIETEAASALEKVNLLTQSILAKAFRGELSADWRAENKT